MTLLRGGGGGGSGGILGGRAQSEEVSRALERDTGALVPPLYVSDASKGTVSPTVSSTVDSSHGHSDH